MSSLVRVDELRPGDELALTHYMTDVPPAFVEELVEHGDGRIVVRWWRPSDPRDMRRRRHLWTHPRNPDGTPKRTRYSLGALRSITEAVDGRELGQLVPLEADELVRVAARKEEDHE